MKLTEQQVPEVFRDGDGRGVSAWIEGFDYGRTVDCWVLTADQVIPTLRDGQEKLCRVELDAVSQWLGRVDPRDIRCVADHDGVEGEPGSWFGFRLVGNALMGRLLIDRTSLGDMLLEVLDSDPSWGFSFSARSADFATKRTDHGEPVDVLKQLRIEEIGPTPSPADASAHVVRIAGRSPKWMGRQDAMERVQLLRDLGVLPASAAWPGRRGWG